jgi:hypothetical protein
MLLDALFGLAFAAAPRIARLTLQHTTTRRIIMQKARGHAAPEVRGQMSEVRTHQPYAGGEFGPPTSDIGPRAHRAPTVRRHTVSGSISLPSRGTFHLSLALLYAIGGKGYLALDGGPPRFTQDYSCPALLGCRTQDQLLSPTRLSLPMARRSSQLRLTIGFVTCRLSRSSPVRTHYTHTATAASYHTIRV